jgi:lipopolysaccharide transport system ATP-binding protein
MNAPAERFEAICADIVRLDGQEEDPTHGILKDPSVSVATPKDALADSAKPSNTEDEPGYDENLISRSMVVYETNGAEISNLRLETLDGRRVNELIRGQRYKVCYEVTFERDFQMVRFRSLIKTTTGVELGGGTFPNMRSSGVAMHAGQKIHVTLEFSCNLDGGTYFLNCGLQDHSHSLHRIIDALVFRVNSYNDTFSFGVVDFCFKSSVSLDDPETMGAM